MRGIFEIKRSATNRFYFVFKSPVGDSVFASNSFCTRTDLDEHMIEVRKTSVVSSVYDTSEDFSAPCFVIIRSANGMYAFSLFGFEGEILIQSEYFEEKQSCIHAILLLKQYAWDAKTQDET